MNTSQALSVPNSTKTYTTGGRRSSRILANNRHTREDMTRLPRTESVHVRLTREDLRMLQRAASTAWPEMDQTDSGLVLALAKRSALEILQGQAGQSAPPAKGK